MLRFKLISKSLLPTLLCLLILLPAIFSEENNETEYEEFKPTKEWQVVKLHQKIPPGLHIRSNLQTGITEAKILDENDTSNSGMILINENTTVPVSNISTNYTPEQLKRMLKNLKDDNVNEKVKTEAIEINGTKFRSYEQLKKDLASAKMDFKTDLEIIRELMDELKNNIDNYRKKVILQDLEYYLHQIDNAHNFVDMGGLTHLHSFIDGDEISLKSEAFRCLASALQGNSKVKVEAIKNGTLSRLLKQLQITKDSVMVNQILVVISTLTRQFPVAQIAFINGGGMTLIGTIFDRYATLDNGKISLRLITLISDWLKEKNFDDTNISKEAIDEKKSQYEKLNMNSILIKEDWCVRFSNMLSTISDQSVDYYDKVVNAIFNIYPICRSVIDHNEVLTFLKHAANAISTLAVSSSDSDDFYFGDMIKLVEEAISLVNAGIDHQEL